MSAFPALGVDPIACPRDAVAAKRPAIRGKAARMPIYLLNSGIDLQKLEEMERKLGPAIPDLVRIQGIQEIDRREAESAGGQAIVLVIVPSTDRDYFERLVNIVARYRGHIFFVLISDEISASDYKRLVQSGGADWVSETAGRQEIVDIIARQRGRSAETAPGSTGPLVVTFMPSAGGVGNSTLAIETAMQMKKAGKERRVCLVDMDLQTSHVCDYLDIEPRLQIQEVVSNPERLDSQLFEMFISRHASGVHIFAAPRSKFEPWDLDFVALDKVFDLIAASYDCILIDLPVTWFPWTPHIVSASTGIVVTGVNTIPGLRQISETLSAIRSSAGFRAEVGVALNRCEHGIFGRVVRGQHVRSVLGDERVFFVRNAKLAVEGINTGAPMLTANPGHKIIKQIGGIAAFCASLNTSGSGRG